MRDIETVVVASVEGLLEEMVPRLGHQRTPVYRGQASAAWPLLPALFRREVSASDRPSWAELEAALLGAFKERAGADLPYEPVTELEWMALASHHGLPTRLTAWSENILAALFFACDPARDGEEGVVWRLMPGEGGISISQDHENLPDQPRLYLPRRADLSMRNQRACFLAHPLPLEDATPETLEEGYELGSDAFVLTRLLIPAEWKGYLRRRLAQMGVDRRHIFPGLHGLSHDLAEEVFCHTDAYEWIFPE
jgi:hypothetical protein